MFPLSRPSHACGPGSDVTSVALSRRRRVLHTGTEPGSACSAIRHIVFTHDHDGCFSTSDSTALLNDPTHDVTNYGYRPTGTLFKLLGDSSSHRELASERT
jgi:hypothetical protein